MFPISIKASYWEKLSDFGGGRRAYLKAAAVDGKIYTGFGYDNKNILDWWEYNSMSNEWIEKNIPPIDKRRYHEVVAVGQKVYVGLGHGPERLPDWWEYDPKEDTWKQKADFSGWQLYGQTSSTSNDHHAYIYVKYVDKEIWEYYPITDKWTHITNYPGNKLDAMVALNDKLFCKGTENNEFWEFNLTTSNWNQKTDFGQVISNQTYGTIYNGKIYVVSLQNYGQRDIASGIWQYDLTSDSWTHMSNYPGLSNDSSVVTSKNDGIYVGLGMVEGMSTSDWWRYNPTSEINTLKTYVTPNAGGIISISPSQPNYCYTENVILKAIPSTNYIFTGTSADANDQKSLSTVREYNPYSDVWTNKAHMNVARMEHTSEVVNNKIYVFGGISSANEHLSSVEEYDLNTDKWTVKKNMPATRIRSGTSSTGNIIYLYGGYRDKKSSKVLETYDVLNDSWSTKASLPTTVVSVDGVVIDNEFHIISYGDYLVYNFLNDSWTSFPSYNDDPNFLGNAINISIDKTIFVINNDKFYSYDVNLQKWNEHLPALCDPRSDLGVGVVDNKIYIIGGFFGKTQKSTNSVEVIELSLTDGDNISFEIFTLTVNEVQKELALLNYLRKEQNIFYFISNRKDYTLFGEKWRNSLLYINNQSSITKTHSAFPKKQWQYTPLLLEGNQTFVFQAIDDVGNESQPITAIVTLDTIPPEVTYTRTPSDNFLYTTTVTIHIKSNDAKFYKYILDNQNESQELPVSQVLVLKDLSISSDGIIHELKLFARDAAGNWQHSPQIFTWVNIIEPLVIKDITISQNMKNNTFMIMQAEKFCSDIIIQGGKGPYTYTIISNNQSETVSLTPSEMPTNHRVTITGIFQTSGLQSLNIRVLDSEQNLAVKSLNVNVVSPLSILNFSVLPPATTNTRFEPVQLSASGGCGQYSFSLINNQNDYIYLSDNILSITPTEVVDLDIPVRVTDSCGYFAEKHFMLRIHNPLAITTQRLHDGIVGKPYELHLSVEGGNDSYKWFVYDGISPSEIQLRSQDGIYKGIPEKPIYGTIVFSVSDSDGRVAYKDFSLQIVLPMTFQTKSLPVFEKGDYYEVQILATGGIPPYTYKIAGSLDNGLSFDNDDGILSGIVTSSGDEHKIVVMAVDNCYPTHNVSITQYTICTAEGLTIISPQVLPDICSGIQTHQPLFTFFSVGGTWPLTWSVISGRLPQGLVLEKNSGGLFNFPQRHGTYNFTIQVQDALMNTHTRECVWHITKKLQIQTLSTPKAPKNSWYSTILSAIGGKQPYQWSVMHGSLPNGLSLDSYTGVISGIPVGDKRRWNESPFIIEVRDNDSPQQVSEKEFYIEVTDQLYIYTSDVLQLKKDVSCEIIIRGENGKPPYVWSLDSGKLPEGLLFRESQNQAIIDGKSQESGEFNFTMLLNDSENNGPVFQSYTLTIIEDVEIIKEKMFTAKRSENYIYLLKARNGTSSYIWNIQSGMLPKGLNLISISDNTYISGTVDSSAKTQSFILEVTDADDSKAQWENIITVIDPLRVSIDQSDSHQAFQYFPYQSSFSLENGIQPYSWQIDSALPEGLSFTVINEQGYIYGIPESCGHSTSLITVEDQSYPPDQRLFPFHLDIICQNEQWKDQLLEIPYPKGNIKGHIQSQGINISNADIAITSQLFTVSDQIGNYAFIDINPGLYTITVIHENFCPFQTTCHMLPQVDITIDIDLFKTDGSALRFDTKLLPLAFKDKNYHERIIAKGGCLPYHFSLCDRLLPEGLHLDETGLISGTPLISGTKELCIMVADSTGGQSATTFVLLDILPESLTITNIGMCCGVQGLYYRDQINIENGFSPYQFTVTNGQLPDGLSLSGTGVISGVCQKAMPHHFEIQVTDNRNQKVCKQFDLNVTTPLIIQPPLSFDGIVGQPVDLQFNATGGCGHHEWHIFKDCLKSGLEIFQDTGQLFGVPAQEIFCTMVIHVNDKAGHVAYKDYLINIVHPLKVHSTSFSPALKDHQYAEFIQVEGGQYPLSFTAIDSLPEGLMLNEKTGEISGIPEHAGGFNFQVFIQDNSISNPQKLTQYFHLPVQSYLTIVTPSELPEVTIDSDIDLSLSAKGGPEPFNWSIEKGGLPGNIVLNQISGKISGKLTEWGTFTFTVRLTDAFQKTVLKTFLWKVYNKLSIKNGYLPDAIQGVPYYHFLEADGGKETYHWEITGGTDNWPQSLLFNTKTGLISGVPVERMDYKIFGISVYDESGQVSSKDIGFSVLTMETIYVTPSPLPNALVDIPYNYFH
ncbi:Ig family protein [Candidatus Magnetomorum sp. HK-1]|nr:Ig family protein [Candidatus Magnetomorum sp. HK-1]